MAQARANEGGFDDLGRKLEMLRSRLSDEDLALVSEVLVVLAEALRHPGRAGEAGMPTPLGTFFPEPPLESDGYESRSRSGRFGPRAGSEPDDETMVPGKVSDYPMDAGIDVDGGNDVDGEAEPDTPPRRDA